MTSLKASEQLENNHEKLLVLLLKHKLHIKSTSTYAYLYAEILKAARAFILDLIT